MKKRTVSGLVVAVASLVMHGPAAGAPADEQVAAAIDRGDYAFAADLLRTRLAETPADEATRFTLARVLAESGEYSAALSEYDKLISLSPFNVDYSFGRAQVLSWTRSDEAAVAELVRARALAPDYEDIWRLELAVLARSNDTGGRLQEFRAQAARQFPESDWWAVPDEETSAPPRTELIIGGVHETLSSQAPDWSSLFLQVSRHRGSGTAVYGSIAEEERFGRSDLVFAGGGAWRMSERWSAGFDLGIGSDADFVPELAAAVWAGQILSGGWETEIRLRQRNYSDTEVTSTALTLGRYFGSFRVAYTLDLSRLEGDSTAAAHGAALNYYISDRTQLDVSLAAGEEAEAIDAGQVLRTDVKGVSLGARHALGGRWHLSCRLGTHSQGDIYTRRYVAFSVATGI